MLAECRQQIGSRFGQKMSADCGFILLLSTKSFHIIRQQIGNRNQAKPTFRYLNCDIIAIKKFSKMTFSYFIYF